jgi:hypothetical protein
METASGSGMSESNLQFRCWSVPYLANSVLLVATLGHRANIVPEIVRLCNLDVISSDTSERKKGLRIQRIAKLRVLTWLILWGTGGMQ